MSEDIFYLSLFLNFTPDLTSAASGISNHGWENHGYICLTLTCQGGPKEPWQPETWWDSTLSFFLSSPRKSEITRRGRSRRGRCANLLQIARQICANCWYIRFIHQREGAQNCRKFVANLKVNFGQFYANTPFPMPPSPNFWENGQFLPTTGENSEDSEKYSGDCAPKLQISGTSFWTPNPHIQGKTMNKNIALLSLSFFNHFGSYFVQSFVHTFALYVGGGGHSHISEFLSLIVVECVLNFTTPHIFFGANFGRRKTSRKVSVRNV